GSASALSAPNAPPSVFSADRIALPRSVVEPKAAIELSSSLSVIATLTIAACSTPALGCGVVMGPAAGGGWRGGRQPLGVGAGGGLAPPRLVITLRSSAGTLITRQTR